MTKTKRSTHSIPVFEVEFQLVVTNSILKIANSVREAKKFDEKLEEPVRGLVMWKNHDVALFLQYSDLTHSVIAHEILHATLCIMEFNNIDIHRDWQGGEETAARVCEALTKIVYQDLNRWKIKIKS